MKYQQQKNQSIFDICIEAHGKIDMFMDVILKNNIDNIELEDNKILTISRVNKNEMGRLSTGMSLLRGKSFDQSFNQSFS